MEKQSEMKTPENQNNKRKVTPEHECKRKNKSRPLFMGQDMETLFCEAEAKKDTYFIYISSYVQDEDVSVNINLVKAEELE